MLMYSRCEKGGRCSFHVGGFASGLQCTSAALPAAITLSQPYLALALPIVALTVLVIVWEVSGGNVSVQRTPNLNLP